MTKEAAELLDRLGKRKCENSWCERMATHAEHWSVLKHMTYPGYRFWCDECTPWSGHYEFCNETCKQLIRDGR